MKPDPSGAGRNESEREGRETLCRCEPEVFVAAGFDLRPELIRAVPTQRTRDTVGRHDEVGISDLTQLADLALEPHVDAERERPLDEDLQEATTAEAVAPASVVKRRLPSTSTTCPDQGTA